MIICPLESGRWLAQGTYGTSRYRSIAICRTPAVYQYSGALADKPWEIGKSRKHTSRTLEYLGRSSYFAVQIRENKLPDY